MTINSEEAGAAVVSAATAKFLQDLASHRFNTGKPRVRSIPGWSIADLAERYSVSKSTVLNWSRCDGFPSHVSVTLKSRTPTKLYDVHAVDAWRQTKFENPPVRDAHCAGIAASKVQSSREAPITVSDNRIQTDKRT